MDEGTRIDAVVPTPMPRVRRYLRGIDHVQAVTDGVAQELGTPITRVLVQKWGGTQARRSAEARRRPRRVFHPWRWGKLVNGKNILLVDDVLTSGQTAASLCRILKTMGAQRILLGVLAVSEMRPKTPLRA